MSNVKRCNHKEKAPVEVSAKQAAAIAKVLKLDVSEVFDVELVQENGND